MSRNYVIFLVLSFVVIVASNFLISGDKDNQNAPQEEVNKEFSVNEDSYIVPDDDIANEKRISGETYVRFSTPLLAGKISTTGGKILDVNLQTYFEDAESASPIKLLHGEEFMSNTIIKAKDIEIPERGKVFFQQKEHGDI